MTIKKMANIKFLSVLFLLCIFSFTVHAQNEVSQEEQIRKLQIKYKNSYKNIKDIRKETELAEHHANIMEQAQYYYDLGKKVEEQGRLKEAESLYKKADKLISSCSIKRYTLKANAKQKNEAKIYKYRVRKTLKKRKKELEKLEKDRNKRIANLEKWLLIRERKQKNKVPKESSKRLEKIEKRIASAEDFSAIGNHEKARIYYKKAFSLSKDLERKKSMLENISKVFEIEIEEKAARINKVEVLKENGDNYYKYANYDNAYDLYIQAYDLMLTPEK